MPLQNVDRGYPYILVQFLTIILILLCFNDCSCFAYYESNKSQSVLSESANSVSKKEIKSLRLIKRSSGKSCMNSSDCTSDIPGSVCVQSTCVCPQGFLPLKKGEIGCFRIGKHLGNYCDHSSQCGEELTCRDHVCLCPDGFQLFHSHGINLCLLWHKPTRLVDRCRTIEDCAHDVNTICKKRWCQCNNGYTLFETMLYGRKHKCFKTLKHHCIKSSQCTKYAESSDQYCMCYYGVCHCLTDLNFTTFDIPTWGDKPNWYQRWKKDLILATRLLFITVILFFVPCFIYVTLGIRERGRNLFSHFVQPSRSPVIHYSQRRVSGHLRPLHSYRGLNTFNSSRSNGTAHHVEISMHTNGVNSRLVDSRSRMSLQPQACDTSRGLPYCESFPKEEDPPPSYEEIMRKEDEAEEPPPPYRAL